MSVIPQRDDQYLGDGVYAQRSSWERNGWWLYTYDGITVTNQIYIEASLRSRLVQMLQEKDPRK